MVNVLYLHNSFLISGGERSLLQLWANLDRREFLPVVALPSEGPFSEEAARLGVSVEFLPVPSLKTGGIGAFIHAVAALASLADRKKIGLIHSYGPRQNLAAACVGRKKNIPVIWHERNLLWDREWDITRFFLGVPHSVVCNSQAVARRFQQHGVLSKKVRVILNGVDTTHFMPVPDKRAAKEIFGWEGRKVIGLVSNLNARKGVETFLAIASLISRSRRDTVFVVVGGDYGTDNRLDVLSRHARDMGLDDRVVFAGFQQDVRPYLAACDVTCNVTKKEACSRAILESMAMGVPVVAFRDGGNPELIEDRLCGLLVPAGDDLVFASRVMALVDNDGERERMGTAARVRVEEKFDIRHNAYETMALYRELTHEIRH